MVDVMAMVVMGIVRDGHHLLEELLAGQDWVGRCDKLKVGNAGKRGDRGDVVRIHQ